MAKLTPASIAVRESQIQEVMLHMINGKKVPEACELAGISTDQYYHWIKAAPQAVETIRDSDASLKREQLLLLQASVNEALRLLVNDMTNEVRDVMERLAIMKFMLPYMESLERQMNVQSGVEDEARKFLKSPRLQHVKSRMASIDVDEKPEGGVSLEISRYDTVIDIDDE